jgi:hypothetical protein
VPVILDALTEVQQAVLRLLDGQASGLVDGHSSCRRLLGEAPLKSLQ